MPLEISEIGVRIAVGPSPAAPAPDRPGRGGGEGLTPARQEQIVAACVQEVLRALRAQEQR